MSNRAIGLCDEFLQLSGVENTNLHGLVLYLRGCCMMDLKRNVEAIIDFTKVISNYQYFRAYISRSVVFQRTGNVEKALNDLNVAIEKNPGIALLFKCRGDLYSKSLKNYEMALRDYNQSILLTSDYFTAYLERAYVYSTLQQYDMALSDCNRCIKLKPDSISCLMLRAQLHEKISNLEAARNDYIHILQLDPNNSEVSQKLQQSSPQKLSKQQSPNRSVTPSISVVSEKRMSPSRQGNLENVRFILQSKIKDISQATSLPAAFRILQMILDILDLHSNSIHESFIDTIVKISEEGHWAELLVPLFHKIIMKDSRRANYEVNSLLASMGDNSLSLLFALSLMIRAMCNEDLGDFTSALNDYDEVIQKFEQKFEHAHLRKASLLLYKLCKPDQALQCLDIYLKLDPRNASAQNMRYKALQMKSSMK